MVPSVDGLFQLHKRLAACCDATVVRVHFGKSSVERYITWKLELFGASPKNIDESFGDLAVCNCSVLVGEDCRSNVRSLQSRSVLNKFDDFLELLGAKFARP